MKISGGIRGRLLTEGIGKFDRTLYKYSQPPNAAAVRTGIGRTVVKGCITKKNPIFLFFFLKRGSRIGRKVVNRGNWKGLYLQAVYSLN